MAELIGWFNAERQAGQLHPLLLIGIRIVVFLEIHPFQDGNGRLSRVLTTLLLLQAGYAYVPTSFGRRTWMAATRASMQCMSVSGSKCCDRAPTSTPCASHNRQAPADVGQKAVRDKAGCATMISRVCSLVVDPECFPI